MLTLAQVMSEMKQAQTMVHLLRFASPPPSHQLCRSAVSMTHRRIQSPSTAQSTLHTCVRAPEALLRPLLPPRCTAALD